MRSLFFKRAVFLASLFFLIGTASGCSADGQEVSEPEKLYKNVRTALVESERYSGIVKYVGRVTAEDVRTASFLLPGKVSEVFVKEGDYITKGQVLASLDSADYEFAVEDAAMNISLLENDARQVNNAIEKIKIGIESERLKTVTLESDISAQNLTLEKEESEYATGIDVLTLNFEQLKDSYEDARMLYEEGAISRYEYDNVRIAYESAEKDLANTELNKEKDLELRRQSILNAERNMQLHELAIANLEADLKDAELKLEGTGIRIEQSRVLLEKNQKNVNDTKLVSSIDGYVMSVNIKEGNVISEGMPAITQRTEDIIIEASLPVDERDNLSPGSSVTLTYADGTVGTGTVSEMSQYPDTATNSYLAEIMPDDKNYAFTLGSLADVGLVLYENEGFFLPINAVLKQEGADYIYEVLTNDSGDSYAALKEVTLGLTLDDKVLAENITEPLTIITEGVQSVKENDIISMPEGGAADEQQ